MDLLLSPNVFGRAIPMKAAQPLASPISPERLARTIHHRLGADEEKSRLSAKNDRELVVLLRRVFPLLIEVGE